MVVGPYITVLGAVQHGGICGNSGKSGKNYRILRFWHGGKHVFDS